MNLRSRNVILSLLVLVLFLTAAMIKWRFYDPDHKELFNRSPGRLQYAAYALCHMACRKISRSDVEAIIRSGVIHLNRSNRRGFPCPTYALQGTLPGGRHLRILLEQCRNATMVLNCYDLKHDINCNCHDDTNEKNN